MNTFIGIDLAWSDRNATGIAVLRSGARGLLVRQVGLAHTLDEIVAVVHEHASACMVVMVDAPLVVPNLSGRRPCEAALAEVSHAQHAAPYPGNRRLLGARQPGGQPRGEALGERLAAIGFAWPPRALVAGVPGGARLVHECYPHPAHVRLFALAQTFKYKRKQGRAWPELRREFARYCDALRALRKPAIAWTAALERTFDVRQAKGRAYKHAEDQLDALCCAYLAALLPSGRLEAFGEPASGMIVVPRASGATAR